MTIRTDDERELMLARVVANRFGVTALHILTPQDGSPNAMTIEAEAWILRDDAIRRSVTAVRPLELVGDTEVFPVLNEASALYEAYRALGVPGGFALYLAIRDAVYNAQRHSSRFPTDAA